MKNARKKNIAREFRRKPTKSERILWRYLRNRNLSCVKFRRQYVLEGFIVDFYCPELQLALEIDGSIHDHLIEEDTMRQDILEERGIVFYRIKAEDVEQNIDSVLQGLKKFIASLS